MANGGINKAQVKKARDSLIARGKNPSIDAVRIELGNTGSKGTIHKYLNELTQEGGVALGESVVLGERLGHIVADLASQLQQEAQAIVKEASETHQAEVKRLNDRIVEQQRLLTATKQQHETLSQSLGEAERSKELLVRSEQELALKAERLAQQLESQEELIAQKDAHIISLEEKHLHARESIEHYRNSVKDQREQDQRRHEHQAQQLQAEIRQLTAQLKTCDESLLNMTTKFTDSARQQRADAEVITDLKRQLAALQHASQSMQVELITTKTELTVKNQLFEALQPRAQ